MAARDDLIKALGLDEEINDEGIRLQYLLQMADKTQKLNILDEQTKQAQQEEIANLSRLAEEAFPDKIAQWNSDVEREVQKRPQSQPQENLLVTGSNQVRNIISLQPALLQRANYGEFKTSSNPADWKFNLPDTDDNTKQDMINFINDVKAKTYQDALQQINQDRNEGDKINLNQEVAQDGKITYKFTQQDGQPIGKELDQQIQDFFKQNLEANLNNGVQAIKADLVNPPEESQAKGYEQTISQMNGFRVTWPEPSPTQQQAPLEQEKQQEQQQEASQGPAPHPVQ